MDDILIDDVLYLKGYNLLISFSNGEDRVIDLSDSFNIPAAIKYANPAAFCQFDFDKYSIWWGNIDSPDSMEIGNDSLYRLSIPAKFVDAPEIDALLNKPFSQEGSV